MLSITQFFEAAILLGVSRSFISVSGILSTTVTVTFVPSVVIATHEISLKFVISYFVMFSISALLLRLPGLKPMSLQKESISSLFTLSFPLTSTVHTKDDIT